MATALIALSGEKLPADVQPIRYEAREAISRPYEIDVEFSTQDAMFDVHACLRERALLTIVDGRGEMRHFDGVADRAEFSYVTGTHYHFALRLRPRLASLAHREGSRIFQDQSVTDVVKKIFTEAGIDDKVEWQLLTTYAPREFIVQYRESELAFVHRLLEDEGIFYFFRQTPDGHQMIVADDISAFQPADDAPEVHFSMAQGLSGESLSHFSRTRSLRTSDVRLRDYDFEKPGNEPEANQAAKEAYPAPLYEYPGGFSKGPVGARRATVRISEQRRDAHVVRGESKAIGLRCGVPFTVEGAAQECLEGTFVVTELRTWGEQTLESGGPNAVCQNEFSGVPEKAAWAPPRVTPKPKIRGIQTVIVTGPVNDEQAIHVDKYGRIKVRFTWDREGQQDDTASCWLRVSQLNLGGSMVHPRLGWEVSVAFFNGDPDQPFVLGRVYNAEKTPPYALPGAQTSGAIKSMSTPGAGGFNELKMGDSGGKQGWNLHAQKDLNITIEHDKVEQIGVDETHNIKVNASISIGSNETIEVTGNQTIDVGSVYSQNVAGDQSLSVTGNETDNATANYVEKIGGSRSSTTTGNHIVINNTIMTTVAGSFSRTVGLAQIGGSIKSLADSVGGAMSETVGAVKIDLAKGKSVEEVGGSKNLTSAAAELHLVKGKVETNAGGGVKHLIGGLHYQKLGGDYSVKAPVIAVIGAVGQLKGGGSEVKLGGGPIVITGSKIVIETALLVKLGASLKMGA